MANRKLSHVKEQQLLVNDTIQLRNHFDSEKKQFARIIAITIEIVDDDDGWGIESQGSLQN